MPTYNAQTRNPEHAPSRSCTWQRANKRTVCKEKKKRKRSVLESGNWLWRKDSRVSRKDHIAKKSDYLLVNLLKNQNQLAAFIDFRLQHWRNGASVFNKQFKQFKQEEGLRKTAKLVLFSPTVLPVARLNHDCLPFRHAPRRCINKIPSLPKVSRTVKDYDHVSAAWMRQERIGSIYTASTLEVWNAVAASMPLCHQGHIHKDSLTISDISG